MKKLIKDPEIYPILGLLGLIFAIPSENLYVNAILIPIFFVMQIVGTIFVIKKYMNDKKAVKHKEKKNKTDASYTKPD
jgi:hypothetical protein